MRSFTAIVCLMAVGIACFSNGWAADAAVSIPVITIKPTQIVKNLTKTNPNVTVSLWPALPYSQVFLLKTPTRGFSRLSYNCSAPPPAASVNLRTAVFTLNKYRKFSFNPRFLDPGTYAVCYRNITQANALWYKYAHFVQLRNTISIVNFAFCRGTKNQFGVCTVLPSFASSGDMNTTVGLYYAAKGTQAFLLKKKIFGVSNTYNCSNPPARSSHLKTPIATVADFSQVKFDIHGLESGVYIICFKNATSKIFAPLRVTMTISGPIDASRSTVSCCNGPFLVGQRTYCQIRALDSSGLPAGGKIDACDFRACPITDGAGQLVDHVMQPYEIGFGLYEFWFVGTRSGCGASVGVSYKGQVIGGNSVQYFTLYPGTVDYTKATANCTYSSVSGTSCSVVQRDSYGNPVSQCSQTIKGKVYCNKFTSHRILG